MLMVIKKCLLDILIIFILYEEMKKDLVDCKVFVWIGEMIFYLNILLESGVIF